MSDTDARTEPLADSGSPANRERRILAAAEHFVAAMHVPEDGNRKLAEWRREQQAAYEALVAAVEDDVVTQEAVDATDS
jgi:hypothetical protein